MATKVQYRINYSWVASYLISSLVQREREVRERGRVFALSFSRFSWASPRFKVRAMKLRIDLPLSPMPQPRPRTRKNSHVVYDPSTARDWKATAQEHMRLAMEANRGGKLFEGPLRLSILFDFPLPASMHRKTPVPERWMYGSRNDLDNLSKAVMDAGNGVLYLDDGHIVWLTALKFRAKQGNPPRVSITIEEMDEDPLVAMDNPESRSEIRGVWCGRDGDPPGEKR